MIDLEIKAFGQRILAWTRRMEPIAALSENRLAGKKYRMERKEDDENQRCAGHHDPANDDGGM